MVGHSIVGLAVLLLGRRLFWLFVGAVGFAVGLHAARAVFSEGPEWLVVVGALVLGVGGAILAIAFQWLAVGLGGSRPASRDAWPPRPRSASRVRGSGRLPSW